MIVVDMEEDPVDKLGDSMTRRCEQDGGDNGGHNRHKWAGFRPAILDTLADKDADNGVNSDHHAGQHHIEQASADDDVHIEELVPDHDETHGDGDDDGEQAGHLDGQKRGASEGQREAIEEHEGNGSHGDSPEQPFHLFALAFLHRAL